MTKTAYRVGDSVTNVISPMMSYFALIIAFVQRYVAKAGIGTLVSLMLPYSPTFLVGWSLLFIAWRAARLAGGTRRADVACRRRRPALTPNRSACGGGRTQQVPQRGNVLALGG